MAQKAPEQVPPQTPPPTTRERFFAWLRSLGIRREPGWIGGVCAGVAARLGIDPLIVRGIVVVVAVLGGPAFLLYAAAWLLLPDRNDTIHLEDALDNHFDSALAGIGVFVLLAILPTTQGFWFTGPAYWAEPNWLVVLGTTVWSLVLLALVVAFIVWVAQRSGGTGARADRADAAASTTPTALVEPTPPPTPPAGNASDEELAAWRTQQYQWKTAHDEYRRQQAGAATAAEREALARRRAERREQRAAERAEWEYSRPNPFFSFLVIGAALAAGGAVTLALGNGAVTLSAVIGGLAVTLAVLAVGVLANGVRGRRGGAMAGFAVPVLIALLVVNVFPQGSHVRYEGSSVFAPVDRPGSEEDVYVAAGGDVTIDLTGFYDVRSAGTGQVDPVALVVGAGRVTVYVPDDESVDFHGVVLAGSIDGVANEPRYGPVVVGYEQFESRRAAGETRPTRSIRLDLVLGAGTITVIQGTPEGAQQ